MKKFIPIRLRKYILALSVIVFVHLSFYDSVVGQLPLYKKSYLLFTWRAVTQSRNIYQGVWDFERYSQKDLESYKQILKNLSYPPQDLSKKEGSLLKNPGRNTVIMTPFYPFVLLAETMATSSLSRPVFVIENVQTLQIFVNYITFGILYLTMVEVGLNQYSLFMLFVTMMNLVKKYFEYVMGGFLFINDAAFTALLGALILYWLTRYARRGGLQNVILSALTIGVASMFRSEFLGEAGIVGFMLIFLKQAADRRRFAGLFLVALFTLPFAWGIRNVLVYGVFVTERSELWQHLYQNIGEFRNPWNIQNSDDWVTALLVKNNLLYGTVDADTFLKMKYLQALFSHPEVIARNFFFRLKNISTDLYPFGPFFYAVVFFGTMFTSKLKKAIRYFPIIALFISSTSFSAFVIYYHLIRYSYFLFFLAFMVGILFLYNIPRFLLIAVKMKRK